MLPELFRPGVWKEVADLRTIDVFRDALPSIGRAPQSPEEYLAYSQHLEAKTFLHGLLVVEESERDIGEVDAPHAVAGLDADELAFERMVYSDHLALPPDATASRDLPHLEVAGVGQRGQPRGERSP